MYVIKEDGSKEKLDLGQIRKQSIPATKGLKNITYEELELRANILFKDGMRTSDIKDIYIKTALDFIDVDCPDATYTAARLKLYDFYHKIKKMYHGEKRSGDVYDVVTFKNYHDYCSSRDMLSYTLGVFDLDKLESAIDSKRDEELTYLGVVTFLSRYSANYKGIAVELPQHFFMSIACFLAQKEDEPTKWALRFYDIFSNLEAMMATPTLSNGRLKNGNCFSCAVGSTPDVLIGIFDSYKTQAIGSKNGTGWGYDWSRVRAEGSEILGIPGAAGGIVPFLKVVNSLVIAVNQLGVRLGAIAVTIESWHKDILDFIKLKQTGGDDRRTAEELFISMSCSDVFMERVEANEDWTLFDPYDARKLTEIHGDDFRKEYLRLEALFKSNPEEFVNEPVIINAKVLWKKYQTIAYGVGSTFLFFKDNTNATLEPVYEEVGIIRCGNLCHEYLSPIKDDEIPLCNLASVNLARVSIEDLPRVTTYMTRALDNVIDVTEYNIPGSKETQMERRSIGLGVAGEAEAIVKEGILYGSDEHLEWIDRTYSVFAKASDKASYELGVERGFCKYDNRFRNYHRRCLAPTSTISIILGTSACFEAVYDKVWKEENIDGVFTVTAPNINPDNFNLYINAYDVPQDRAIMATARRQVHIDMGISHSAYFRPETTTGKMVFDMYMLAWKLKLKTVYYIRSKSLRVDTSDLETRDVESEICCVGCAG